MSSLFCVRVSRARAPSPPRFEPFPSKPERATAAAIRAKTGFKVVAHKNVIVSENPDAAQNAQNQVARTAEVLRFVFRALTYPRTVSTVSKDDILKIRNISILLVLKLKFEKSKNQKS